MLLSFAPQGATFLLLSDVNDSLVTSAAALEIECGAVPLRYAMQCIC